MHFGRVGSKSDLDGRKFEIPKTIISNNFAFNSTESKSFQVHIGAPAWGIPGFVGKIYPKNTRPDKYLHYYSRIFDSIELNTTFYRFPEEKLILDWKSQVTNNFKFCPKIPKEISHMGGMNDGKLVKSFFDTVEKFEQNLGMVFMLLHESFSSVRIDELRRFIDFVPENTDLAIEFRHKDWFSKQHNIFEIMENKNISLIITDVVGRPDVLYPRITSEKLIIRFAGNDLHETDFPRADNWIDKIVEFRDLGVREIFLFVHEPDKSLCVEIARYFVEKLQNANIQTINQIDLISKVENTQQFSLI